MTATRKPIGRITVDGWTEMPVDEITMSYRYDSDNGDYVAHVYFDDSEGAWTWRIEGPESVDVQGYTHFDSVFQARKEAKAHMERIIDNQRNREADLKEEARLIEAARIVDDGTCDTVVSVEGK